MVVQIVSLELFCSDAGVEPHIYRKKYYNLFFYVNRLLSDFEMFILSEILATDDRLHRDMTWLYVSGLVRKRLLNNYCMRQSGL